MRKMLATAAALGPLCVASAALAEVTVTTERTTPITTGNATGTGTADSVKITSGGKIVLDNPAADTSAVTLNSSHSVTNEGQINITKAPNGATGIEAVGGNTGNVTNTGTISVKDDYTPTDKDNDGDLDGATSGDPNGAFATGTGRHGIHVSGASALIGDVTQGRAGSVDVDGDQSYGIRIEPGLQGKLSVDGTVKVTGNQSYGVRTQGAVSGDVDVGGTVSVVGQGSAGVALEGNVGGGLRIDGQIGVTGYRSVTRPTTAEARAKLDADDKLQGGSAVLIGADVAGGIEIDTIQPDKDTADTDEDDDGVPDAEETSGTITAWGSAPAVQVGVAGRNVTVGAVGATANTNYGLINKGDIGAHGVYDGVDSTAVKIGGNAGQTATLANGMLNTGNILATAVDGNTTAVLIDQGASVATVRNSGNIRVEMGGDAAKNATALHIRGTGATQSVVNEKGGVIQAVVLGEAGNAIGIRDEAGSLTSISNNGTIAAVIQPTDGEDDTNDTDLDPTNETVTGQAVAVDLSANNNGVTLRQWGINDGDDGADGKADPDDDADGVDNNDEAAIIGAIKFGGGADTLNIENGRVAGDVSFGAGADVLTIGTAGAGGTAGEMVGQILDSDGALAVTVNNGVLNATNASAVSVSSLSVGGNGQLIFNINPNGTGGANGTRFNVSGAANFAQGAAIGVTLTDVLDTLGGSFVLVQAGSINADALTNIDLTDLGANTPYLYVPDLELTGNQLVLQLDRRTAEEAQMIAAEAAAYDAIYGTLQENDTLGKAFLAQLTREDFFALYSQMLPDHSGGTLLSLASGVDAVTRALADRRPEAPLGETTAWIQELNFYADKEKGQSYGFRSDGFGVAGGLERGTTMGAFGLSTAFTSSDIEDPQSAGDEALTSQLLELGLYWRGSGESWRAWARGAAGYAMFDSTRQLIGAGINAKNEADWSGFSLSAGAGASYEMKFGRRWFMRPEVIADYFYLSEDSREESGADGFDLVIDGRDGHMFSGIAALNFGGRFGTTGWMTPELRLGWRQNISFDAGETVARFRNAPVGDPGFILIADELDGGGPLVGFRLLSGNTLGFLAIEGGAEWLNEYARYSLLLRAGFRF